MSVLPDAAYNIYGFLSPAEMELLYRLAADAPKNGCILEIGSFQGKSTVCLGLGAKEAGAAVWAVDPHEDHQVNETTHYGMENHAALLKNLVEFGVADVVRVIALESMGLHAVWGIGKPIHLLWIDGCHDYHSVCDDLIWSVDVLTTGKIVLHDASGHFPDVNRALDEFLADGTWKVTERVDATVVLEQT